MERLRFIVLLTLFFIGTQTIQSQTATTNSPTTTTNENKELLNLDHEDWSFFADEENKVYYIDFESIKVNLSDIVVKDEKNNIIFEDEVVHLPVNTIYELDASAFQAGKYRIELRSYTNSFEKEITIR